jgi:hypothetical protein
LSAASNILKSLSLSPKQMTRSKLFNYFNVVTMTPLLTVLR